MNHESKLYCVQTADTPYFVAASSYAEALAGLLAYSALEELELTEEDVENIALVSEDPVIDAYALLYHEFPKA